MTRPFDAYVLNEQTPTSTGIVTYTVPDVGSTPVGAIVQVIRVSNLDTKIGGLSYCWGVADGTNEHSITNRSKDNVTTVESRVQRSETEVVRLVASDGTVSIVATVDSFITDGIKLDFTTVEAFQFRMSITLIFGSETEGFAFHSAAPTSGSPVTITPGFATDVVFTHDARSSGTAAERDVRAYFGIAARGETKPNVFAGLGSKDNISTSITKRISADDRLNLDVGFPTTNVSAGFVEIGTYTSTTFDVIYGTGMVTAARGLIGLALKLPASHGYTLDHPEAFPTSTGSKTHTTSFKPALIYTTNSLSTSANDDSTSGAVALGVCDWKLEQSCLAVTEKHNVSTTETWTAFSHDFHYLLAHDGVLKQQAAVTDHSATEFDYNVSTATATGRFWSLLTIEELPFSLVVGGALPAPSLSATVDQGFTAAITGTIPAPSLNATVDQAFDVAITGTLPAPSLNAAIAQVFTVTAAGALPAPSISATVNNGFSLTITGTLPAPAFSRTDIAQTFTIAASGSLPAPSLDAVVAVFVAIDIAISGALPAPSLAATVDQAFDLAVSGALPAPSLAAVVAQGHAIVIAGDLPAPSLSATIDQGHSVAVTGALPAPTLAGVIDQGFTVAAAGALPAPSLDAVIDNAATTTIEISGPLPAPSIAATVDQTFTLAASGALPAPSITAAITVVVPISIAISGALPAPSIAAVIDQGMTVGISGSLPAPSLAAVIDQGFSLAVAGDLPAPSLDAVINNATGTTIAISGPLPAPAISATIDLGFSIVVVGSLPAPTISATIVSGEELGCNVLLQGDYALSTGLLGDYLSSVALDGDYKLSSALAGDHASSAALLGDYGASTSLEGSIC